MRVSDVGGVRVGQVTVVDGDSVRTGITVIHPHSGNAYRERVPAALHVGNGFGKLLGATQLGGRLCHRLFHGRKRSSSVRRAPADDDRTRERGDVGVFQATVEATEEAIYNSLTMATAVTSRGRTVEPLPLDRLREILAKYGIPPTARR